MLNPHYKALKTAYIFPVIEEKMAAFKKNHPKAEVLNLGVGDVCLPLLPEIAEAISQGAKEMTQKVRGYGPCNGYLFLREAICKKEYEEFGIAPDEIFINDGANADGADLQELFDTNATVAIPDPTYPLYRNACLLAGKKILPLPLKEEKKFIPEPPKEHADLVYLCTPSNPTGVAFTQKDLEKWIAWAKKEKALLLFDNVYHDFAITKDVPPTIYALKGAKEVAIELRSFSKSAGFTGLRCGYTVIPKTLFLPDFHSLWNKRIDIKRNGISYPIQKGALACTEPPVVEKLKKQIAIYQKAGTLLRSTLSQHDQIFFGGVDAPYIWWKVPKGKTSWEFFDLLLEKAHIVAIPGVGFGPQGEGYLRLSCFLSEELAKKSSNALHNYLSTN